MQVYIIKDTVPFGEDSHSGCAQDVQGCFLVFVFGNVLGSKAEQWMDIITGFLGCFSQIRDSCGKKTDQNIVL